MPVFSHCSPLGTIGIDIRDQHIIRLAFCTEAPKCDPDPDDASVRLFSDCARQLDGWFGGRSSGFSLPVRPDGTAFQRRVWSCLMEIPFGTTITYLELAERLGDPGCIRAAAAANGRNPVAIIIPCHRVIGKNGSLTGYAWEVWRKDWLLQHERKLSGKSVTQVSKQGLLF